MLSFTPKNKEVMTVVPDALFYTAGDEPLNRLACYRGLQLLMMKVHQPEEIKIWIPIDIPYEEDAEIICGYIQFIKDLGGFGGTFDTQFEYRDDIFYLTFKINPKTFSYRRLILLGSMLRGISCYWYIAVFFAHFRKLYPEGPLLNLWVLAHAKFDHHFHVQRSHHYQGHSIFCGDEVVANSKKILYNPFIDVPIFTDRGMQTLAGGPLGFCFTPHFTSGYLNTKAVEFDKITAETLREDYDGL